MPLCRCATMSWMGETRSERALTWYHTIDLPSGPTPGEYDHRGVVDKVPWPTSLAGARCLDVGTHDGFWAFEMERRGADAVLAIDIADPDQVDWPEPRPAMSPEVYDFIADRKTAFHVAREALGSRVEHRYVSVYELDPADVGQFDLVYVGTLLHHLRDPVGALMAIRRVCRGQVLVSGVVSLSTSMLMPTKPMAELLDFPNEPFWSLPNIAGLRRQVASAGFGVVRRGPLHLQPTGAGARPEKLPLTLAGLRTLPYRLMLRKGAPHVCLLARPNC